MRKIAGIILSAAFVLILAACNNGTFQEEGDVLINNTPPLYETYETQEEPIIKTGVFAELDSSERNEEITHIVLHFISNVIENRANPYIIEDIQRIFRDYGVSAHYIIDRDGTIHLVVPENRAAHHAGPGMLADFPEYENNLNQHSIGIELLGIGTQEEMALYLTASEYNALDPNLIGFTDAQYDSLNWLLHDILVRHSSIQPSRTHIIGHSEYNPSKADPGALFEWDRLEFMSNS